MYGLRRIALVGLLSVSTNAGLGAAEPDLAPKDGASRGLYLSLGAGLAARETDAASGDGSRYRAGFDPGPAAFAAIGYGFGLFRVESEFAYRQNDSDGVAAAADRRNGGGRAYSIMVNGLFEPFPDWRMSPYVGAGLGLGIVDQDRRRFSRTVGNDAPDLRQNYTVEDDTDARFAYQAIAGARFSINESWSLRADYRYFATLDTDVTQHRTLTAGAPPFATDTDRLDSEFRSHAVTLGVTYHFGQAARPTAPTQATPASTPTAGGTAPPAAPTPPAPAERPREETFVIFFDFDKAEITPASAAVLDRAVAQFRTSGRVKVVVDGHADRSGPRHYNQRLSERRALAVSDYLTTKGIPENQIAVAGHGEEKPRAPTPDGVRHPENRRAEIVIR